MTRRVAVTGATGFIGSHVVHRLGLAGRQVRILARRLPTNPLFRDMTIEAVIGSLADERSLDRLIDGADAVIHIAGLVKARSRAEFLAANAAGTKQVVAAALRTAQTPRLLHFSSLAAREPLLSDYAASKRAGEQAVEDAGRRLTWTILRPPAVYGPGDVATLTFFRALKSGFAPLPAARDARLSLIHASDLAAAAVATLDSEDAASATFELDDGRAGGYRWEEMVETAAGLLGVHARLVRIPPLVLRAAAAANMLGSRLSGKRKILTPGKAREMLHPDWACHDRRILAAVNWRPTIGIEKGFAETIAWYRQRGWV